MMISAQLGSRTVSGLQWTDKTGQSNVAHLLASNVLCSASPDRLSLQLCFTSKRCNSPKSVVLICRSSRGSFGRPSSKSADDHDHDHDFLQASLLIPETTWHYRMRNQGSRENLKGQRLSLSVPFSVRTKDPRGDVTAIGQDFLRRFQSPTIFLKIFCDGDFLLPIIVGESAIDNFLYTLSEDDGDGNEKDCPDQFQFIKIAAEKLGYEVNMVRITERVVNTYLAQLFLSKPGKDEIISLDIRPSDAINVANGCKAPIYVSKDIVLKDAVRIGYYGMGRARKAKATYDVSLDSAPEGRDSVTEELDLMRNMDVAVKEERYNDAANLRDKLLKLRKSLHHH